jgi:hypothetical protein
MSSLAIAFPAEVAVPVARTVIEGVSHHVMPLIGVGVGLLLARPLTAATMHAISAWTAHSGK